MKHTDYVRIPGITRLVLGMIHDHIKRNNIGLALNVLSGLDKQLGLIENEQKENVDDLESIIIESWK